jgi:hypothetical protein
MDCAVYCRACRRILIELVPRLDEDEVAAVLEHVEAVHGLHVQDLPLAAFVELIAIEVGN